MNHEFLYPTKQTPDQELALSIHYSPGIFDLPLLSHIHHGHLAEYDEQYQ